MTPSRLSVSSPKRAVARLGAILVFAFSCLVTACGGSSSNQAAPTPTPAPSLDLAAYITIEEGDLPVVLSAPHGGTLSVPGVPVRQTGTTVRDTNTLELALAIEAGIAERTGRRAFLVASKVSRSYVDFNRSAEQAYETPAIATLYTAYQAALSRAAQAARTQSPAAALLVDIHGQSSDVTVVFRGTRNGQTASLATLCAPPGGFLYRLVSGGIAVVPPGTTGAENPDYDGGYIVGTYGLTSASGVNAVQLEFGMRYRESAEIQSTASRVADAIVEHLRAHASGIL